MSEESTAYHEAGHAAACYVLKRGFSCVSIIPDENSGGRVELRKMPSFLKLAGDGYSPDGMSSGQIINRLRRELLIDLAGTSAQKTATGQCTQREHKEFGTLTYMDRAIESAELIIQALNQRELRKLLRSARGRAEWSYPGFVDTSA